MRLTEYITLEVGVAFMRSFSKVSSIKSAKIYTRENKNISTILYFFRCEIICLGMLQKVEHSWSATRHLLVFIM